MNSPRKVLKSALRAPSSGSSPETGLKHAPTNKRLGNFDQWRSTISLTNYRDRWEAFLFGGPGISSPARGGFQDRRFQPLGPLSITGSPCLVSMGFALGRADNGITARIGELLTAMKSTVDRRKGHDRL
jgi:hypothetical protein